MFFDAPFSAIIAPIKQVEYGVYGDLILIYPKPDSIYLTGTIGFREPHPSESQGLCSEGLLAGCYMSVPEDPLRTVVSLKELFKETNAW